VPGHLPAPALPHRVPYRYYTDIDADRQAWLGHYNFERPHRRYRLAGHRPADIFYATRPDLPARKGWTDGR
jgi:hypothetical protein